jgi:hypothetical protein
MRPLCGAIITVGALIGLGLTAIGFGTRYGQIVTPDRNRENQIIQMQLADMDKPLVFILVFLTAMAIIGLGMAFVGLAYHHHKRTLEHAHLLASRGEPHHPMGTT